MAIDATSTRRDNSKSLEVFDMLPRSRPSAYPSNILRTPTCADVIFGWSQRWRERRGNKGRRIKRFPRTPSGEQTRQLRPLPVRPLFVLPLSHSRHDHSLSMPYRPCPSTKLHLSVRPASVRAKIIPSLKPIASPSRPEHRWDLEMQSISLGCDRTPCHEGWDRLSPIPFVDEVSLSSLHCLFFDFPSRGLQDNQALTAISFAPFFGPSHRTPINQPVFLPAI